MHLNTPVSLSSTSLQPGVSVSFDIPLCALLIQSSLARLFSSVHNAPFCFLPFCLFDRALPLNLTAQAVILSTLQHGLRSSSWSHSSGLCSFAHATTSLDGFFSLLASVERANIGCSGHSSSCCNHSGPMNQFLFSILPKDAPLATS